MRTAFVAAWVLGGGAWAWSGEPSPGGGSPLGDLLEAGRAWWEENMPADVREQVEFPDLAALEAFLADLEADLHEGSLERLAAYEPDARRALSVLRGFEAGRDLADWLEPRLDLLAAAGEAVREGAASAPAPSPGVRAAPTRPGAPPAARVPEPERQAPGRLQHSRLYWQRVVAGRAPPGNAARLVPQLKRHFRAAGVPPEWVWIAEVESSMNPKARSPAGARGLFQFMPATAERFGLSTSWPDERLDPDRSARAAAEYLRLLHGRFGSWPLALAAYNSGEGRVGRLLAGARAKSFDAIAGVLPGETRLYVPKVLATVAVREGVDPEALPPPAVARRAPKSDDSMTLVVNDLGGFSPGAAAR